MAPVANLGCLVPAAVMKLQSVSDTGQNKIWQTRSLMHKHIVLGYFFPPPLKPPPPPHLEINSLQDNATFLLLPF
eukprot:1397820-Ditylum_brightwellii.AAC.1